MSNIYIEITLNEVCYLTDLHVLAALFVHFLKTAVSDKFWACQIIIFPCTIIIFWLSIKELEWDIVHGQLYDTEIKLTHKGTYHLLCIIKIKIFSEVLFFMLDIYLL